MTASELNIIAPAFLASLLVLSTHVPLGTVVLRRGIIFIDLAIAQVAGLGVIAADAMGWEAEGWMVQFSAISAALIAAFILHQTDKRFPEIQEALIGVAFVLAATIGILLLAGNPHGGEHLKELLVGQVLWVNDEQLIFAGIVTALILVAWYWIRDHLQGFGFYGIFAFAVTVSVQLVGIYMVFACLIIPALATRRIHRRGVRMVSGFAVGIAGCLIGLILTLRADLPAGAVMVMCMAAVALIFASTIKRL
ncbi:MAG: metal ABC transporter permease [Gammaproteobacteria bacterium]|nr:metal ABC transporter permease [Gammaproteobacteria bacterium]MDH3373820.1 metal ABC transporter permease [Gammaproteobacteria bacterium]MDH3409446.1 metal ABC transporter permease [Gammaproteobacteria bacterium]MDH3554049.1 metal ABC transporter permease [Gammaproteobacteria bacterium]